MTKYGRNGNISHDDAGREIAGRRSESSSCRQDGCSRARPDAQVVIPRLPLTAAARRPALFVECTGAGPDVTILIHAFSMDRRLWEPQVAALRTGARVIAYDLRAHGQSAPQTTPFMAPDDLLGLTDELRVNAWSGRTTPLRP